ncbi:MAG: hypothetical protein KTR27_16425 [Leptolyngbyaceae cyanobacterium MAG.088]|nr:hypothetical protein [Leptolyngbyaceae cyanobacterium MAG.088]
MSEEIKNTQKDEQISDEQLTEVSGGNSVHKTRLEHLDNQSKSVKDIQETRLDHLDHQSK